ncbi:MAG: type II toxin-antitoxin system HicA family toxin [Candidatus Kerfeldbacteria bacterium]|nr:type II toxin-antitoxin system HicA family toxin [Candidatus Kerfeldbacteria bacterium]
MPKLVPIKPKPFIKILLKLGFVQRDAEGSHVFFRHADGRTTVVPVHNKEISRGLLRKILNDIQISVKEYDALRRK